MAGRRLTDFEQVLLGLVCAAPSTGYDLKQEFAITPLGVYQPSSGAIYPALRRLESGGLLRAERTAPRRRVVYHITDQGRAAHDDWVRQPVNPANVAAELDVHLMRFVMMEHLVSRREVLAFLADLRDALTAFLNGLESYAASAATGLSRGRHPALALDHGISVHLSSLAWVKRTMIVLAAAEAGESPSPSGAVPPDPVQPLSPAAQPSYVAAQSPPGTAISPSSDQSS